MERIRNGDTVMAISGKDKGRMGKVLSVVHKTVNKQKVTHYLVEGLNVVKKHTRANPDRQIAGGIISKEKPMPGSKVALVDPVSGKPSRVGIKTLENGDKVRYLIKTGEVIDV